MIIKNKIKKIIIIIGAVILSALILLFSLNKTNKTILTLSKVENKYEILVDVEESKLFLFNCKKIEKIYSCSGGKWSTPSPIGTWKIIQKATWGEGFRRTLDGIECSMGEIWNTWNIEPKYCRMGKLPWLH